MARANELFTPEEMKKISDVPSSDHVHKLVQVTFFVWFFLFCP